MADTTFTSGTIIRHEWLNDVNTAVYKANSGFSGYIARTLVSKLTDFGISPLDFGAVGDGSTDDSGALATAFSAAKAAGVAIDLGSHAYKITTPIILDGYASFNIISRGASIVGPTSGAMTCLLDIRNSTDFNIIGRLGIVGNYNTSLTCGIWIHANASASTCSLINIASVAFSGCQLAYRIGDTAFPDKTVSEISVFDGYTYGCPCAIQTEGTQTVVSFMGCIINSDYGSGGAPWQAITQTTVRAIGGLIRITGGEVNHASVTTGQAFDVQPVTSATYGNPFGNISCSNVTIETAAQLATSSNPGAIAAPAVGRIDFFACAGFHSTNTFAFIQTDSTFGSGTINVQNCNWYCSVARSQPNIQCASNSTNVYCDEQSFGTNFLSNLRGITGGTPHFRNKLIFNAGSPNNALTAGTPQIIKYQTLDNADDSTRYNAGYSTSTGRLTIPAGGLKDISINVGFTAGAATPTDVFVYVNGAATDSGMSVTGGHSFTAYIKSLASGDIIDVRAQPNGAGITPTASNLNHFRIMASN